MPVTATPTIKVRDLRVGDYLPGPLDGPLTAQNIGVGETVVARLTPAQRGKAKGQPRFTLENARSGDQRERIFPDPNEEVTVMRQVPTAEERQAYREADSLFYRLTRVVEALADVNRRLKDVQDSLSAFNGRSILGRGPADLEAAAARYVTLREAYAREIKTLGVTEEQIVRWGADRYGDIDGSDSLYAYSPKTPANVDCYLDGTVAVHPDPSARYVVAPLYPETTEA